MPITKEDAREATIARLGRLFDNLTVHPGWQQVYLPRIKAKLDELDRKCHDGRCKEDSILFNNGMYNGLKWVIDLAELIERERRRAERHCEDNGINID